MVLYQGRSVNYPVIDGFFVVEDHAGQARFVGRQRGAPQRTVVLLQVTLAKEHHTETNKLMSLKDMLRAQFSNWEDFTRDAQWEVIYFQPDRTEKMTTRQRCTIPQGMEGNAAHKDAHEFWNMRVWQYQKSVSKDVLLFCALLLES
ncbi:putative retrotransposon hot spot protein 4 (RHS4) [Trypanosoma vivax]|nr:putative retrotransposon hot spot protein 4 (RHS4) [Trypanosoma vivax]